VPPLKKKEKMYLGLVVVSAVVFVVWGPLKLVKNPPFTEPSVDTTKAVKKEKAVTKAPAAATPGATPQAAPLRAVERVKFEGWGRDPFLQEQRYLEQAKSLDSFRVSGVSLRGSDRYALINGAIVRVGETIEGMRVLAIDKDRVRLGRDGREWTLRVGG